MNFQKRFNILKTVTEILLKFMKLVLTEIREDFNTFPESLYKERNALDLKDKFQTFVFCLKCHKFYEKSEVKNFYQNKIPTIIKCYHVKFSNSSRCQLCLC